MTQQPSSHPVASWWARRETSSVDSNYRYPTRTTPRIHGATRAERDIHAAGSDCSPRMWQICLVRRGTRICRYIHLEGTGIGWYHRQIAGCSSNVARYTLICSVRGRSQSIKRDPICAQPRYNCTVRRSSGQWNLSMTMLDVSGRRECNSKSYWSSINSTAVISWMSRGKPNI